MKYAVVDPCGRVQHTFKRRADAELCAHNFNSFFGAKWKFKVRRRWF